MTREIFEGHVDLFSLLFVGVVRVERFLAGKHPRLGCLIMSSVLVSSKFHPKVEDLPIGAAGGMVSLPNDVFELGGVSHVVDIDVAGGEGRLAALASLHHPLVL